MDASEKASVRVDAKFAGAGAPGFLDALRRVERTVLRRRGRPAVVRVFAVDPGKVTGLSAFWCDSATGKVLAWAETLLAHGESQQARDAWRAVEILSGDGGRTDIVVESFTVRRIAMEHSFLSPARIGAKFELLWEDRAVELLGDTTWMWVQPSEMTSMDDMRLKRLGHYTPGPDHRRDATRHALLHIRRAKSKRLWSDLGRR